MQIDMGSGSAAALWQWLCASVLFSARIKSNAGGWAAPCLSCCRAGGSLRLGCGRGAPWAAWTAQLATVGATCGPQLDPLPLPPPCRPAGPSCFEPFLQSIRMHAAMAACKELFAAGLTTPQVGAACSL